MGQVLHDLRNNNFTVNNYFSRYTEEQEVNATSEELITKKSEVFYQRILEKRYNGGHFKTIFGVTDITTSTMHIEIKKATDWIKAYRQLLGYNAAAPRKDLRLYLFDVHERKAPSKTDIIAGLASRNAPPVSLYILDSEGNETAIYEPLKFC